MNDLEKARGQFQKAGLAFPNIPVELAAQLKERDEWLYSTRELETSPYIVEHFIREADETNVADYAILAHSGHGINSYAISYYLVHGPLRMFLFIGWGGAYTDVAESAARISRCFALADEIVEFAPAVTKLQSGQITIAASEFLPDCNYWSASPGKRPEIDYESRKRPEDVLAGALRWLKYPEETRPNSSTATVPDCD